MYYTACCLLPVRYRTVPYRTWNGFSRNGLFLVWNEFYKDTQRTPGYSGNIRYFSRKVLG